MKTRLLILNDLPPANPANCESQANSLQKGLQKGVEQRLSSIRRHIRSLLQLRRPSLAAQVGWLDEVRDADRLDSLFDTLVAASDDDAAAATLDAFRKSAC